MYMGWTDNPVRDAERHYSTLPEIVGYCPFCGQAVYRGNKWNEGDDYLIGRKGAVAHADCYDKKIEEQWHLQNRAALLDEEEEEALEDMSMKLRRFE